MTELYQVPPDASLESVRHALGQWRKKRIALELPEGWLELNNVARMRLVQRQAQIQQNEIAIITREPATRTAAKQVGVPTFQRAEQAAGDGWRMAPMLPLVDPRHPGAGLPDPPAWRRQDIVDRQTLPTQRQARRQRIKSEAAYRRPTPMWMRLAGNILMGMLIIAALAGFTFYVLPAATITLTPGRLPLQTDLPMTAIVGLDTADIGEGQLPARLLKAELVEQGAVPTTGTSQKATSRATGEVVFTNLSAVPVTIPANTLVSTSSGTPVEFRTLSEASVEGGAGQRVSVAVEAVEPGTTGNVRANTISNVVGALSFRLRVNNSGGTFGGGAELVSVVSQQDRDRMVAILLEAAEAKAYETLRAQLEPGEWLPPESVQTFVLAQSFDQYSDEVAQQLNGSIRVLVQGLTVNEQQATGLILDRLQELVPERGRLVLDSVRAQRQPQSQVTSSTVAFTMTVSADYTTPIDPDELRDAIAGMAPEEAERTIRDRWLIEGAPDVYLDPAWKGVLPSLTSRIQVRVNYGE
ncbi:MAG: baseplate J/gp47 family protein [Caldilinea sp.]